MGRNKASARRERRRTHRLRWSRKTRNIRIRSWRSRPSRRKKTGAKFVSCALRFLCAAFPPEQACLVPSAPPAAHVAAAFPLCRTTADRLSTSHATGKCYCRTFAGPTSSDIGPPIEALPEPLSQVCTRPTTPCGVLLLTFLLRASLRTLVVDCGRQECFCDGFGGVVDPLLWTQAPRKENRLSISLAIPQKRTVFTVTPRPLQPHELLTCSVVLVFIARRLPMQPGE